MPCLALHYPTSSIFALRCSTRPSHSPPSASLSYPGLNPSRPALGCLALPHPALPLIALRCLATTSPTLHRPPCPVARYLPCLELPYPALPLIALPCAARPAMLLLALPCCYSPRLKCFLSTAIHVTAQTCKISFVSESLNMRHMV